ncbi:hypothetical protein MNBD_ALPHA03-1278 [hydrothermal vent metagenome]|uniref:DNA transfer protein p32 n=1 Tax=hydrothermal vent metagenome TaxID=652676 RepID=A0A3B1BTG5_9ZZZZ
MLGAIIGGISSIGGANQANQAAQQQSGIDAQTRENASRRTMEMQRRSNEELQRQYELTRRDTLPGRQTGVGAMNWLNQMLLPGQYQSYTDPNITGTPEYLRPMIYGPDGSASVQQGEYRNPYSVENAFNYTLDGATTDDWGQRFQQALLPDPANFLGGNDTGPGVTVPNYNPSPGRRGTEFDGGRSLQAGSPVRSGQTYDQNGNASPDGRVYAGGPGGYFGPGGERRGGAPGYRDISSQPTQGQPAQGGQSPFMPSKFKVGDFKASPGYGFRVNEGEKGVQNYLSANKMRLSGAGLKAMEKYRQGTASDEYGNFFNRELAGYQQTEQDKQNYLGRIFQMAGFGPQSVNTAATAGANTASGVAGVNSNAGNALSNIAMQSGANQANIAGARANNYNNALQSGAQNFMAYRQQQQMMNQFNRGSGGGSGAYNPYDDPSSRQYNEYQ